MCILFRNPFSRHRGKWTSQWLSGKESAFNAEESQESQVQSLGWEDPLEEGMTTYSSILAWRIPWTEEPGELQSMGSQRIGHY